MPDMTLAEAAQVLGIGIDAVRKRVKRGNLPAHKDDAGRWLVMIEGQEAPRTDIDPVQVERMTRLDTENAMLRQRVADLEAERDYLRDALREAQGITRALLPTRAETATPPRSLWDRLRGR